MRLLIGAWSHQAAQSARPGPHLDLTAEMAAWFDRWLRGTPTPPAPPIVYFARHATPPGPDTAVLNGAWQAEPSWPSPRVTLAGRTLGGGTIAHRPIAGTGVAAWNSCAGALPWGQPTDQRYDDAASLVWQWPVGEPLEILGYPSLALRVTGDRPIATVSAKLCDVAPDGTSTLVTRGLVNLASMPAPAAPAAPGWPAAPAVPVAPPSAVVVELEATSWTFPAGHRVRLAVTGMDWPNTVAPPAPVVLTVDGDRSVLTLPVCSGAPVVPTPPLPLLPVPPLPPAPEVVWRVQDDVLRRHTVATTRYGSTYDSRDGTCTDEYTGEVGIDRRTWAQWARSGATFTLSSSGLSVRTHAEVTFTADERQFTLAIDLVAYEGDELVAERGWRHAYPRDRG